MKKSLFTLAFVLFLLPANAQGDKGLDTIYANDKKNVAMFFPQPITQGLIGASHFVFTYNREKGQHLGLLQAKPGEESNLLVICDNGSIYSYIVRYKSALSRLNYFISEDESVGNEKPINVDSIKKEKPQKVVSNKDDYGKRFSSYLLRKKQGIGRLKKRKHGIILSVENIVFNKEQLYFVVEIENKSSLDYDLNYLNLSVGTRQKGKKKSVQTLMKKPLFKYNLPSTIRKGKSVRLVYVLNKFSLSNDRRAILELNEDAGERNIKLKIGHRFINNPK